MKKVFLAVVAALPLPTIWASYYAWHYFGWSSYDWFAAPLLLTNIMLLAAIITAAIEAFNTLTGTKTE